MRYWLKHLTQMHPSVAILLLTGALLLWLPDYLRASTTWTSLLSTQVLVCMNALFLCTLLYQVKATAHFTLLPAVLYALTTAVFPFTRLHWQPQVLVFAILLFLYLTREVSDRQSPDKHVFFSTLLLCVVSLSVPDALWCIPFLWVAVLMKGSFSLRTLTASLLAAGMFGIYDAIAIYLDWTAPLSFAPLVERAWCVSALPQPIAITTLVVVIAATVITSAMFMRGAYDLISVRMLRYHFGTLLLTALPLVLWAAQDPGAIVLLILSTSGVTSIFLQQQESESRGITLLLYLIAAPALYVWLLLAL